MLKPRVSAGTGRLGSAAGSGHRWAARGRSLRVQRAPRRASPWAAGCNSWLPPTGPTPPCRGRYSARSRSAAGSTALQARKEAGGAVLKFIAAAGEENLQDRMGLLADRPDDVLREREVSPRLRHIASSIHHQQFHDSDIVAVRVEVPEADRGR